jgi:hypothetical protein
MATKTTENDDLLILADEDISTDSLVMEDEKMNEDIIWSTDELITFNEDETPTNNDADVILDPKEEENSIDLWEVKEENNEDENSLDLWDFTGEVVEEESDTTSNEDESIFGTNDLIQESGSVWTMEDILDRTMLQLESRSEIILKDKESEETNISDLKEQIKSLDTQVSISKEKVSKLDEEETMIEKNIKSIERMKKTDITTGVKSNTSTRVHNVKRKQAA